MGVLPITLITGSCRLLVQIILNFFSYFSHFSLPWESHFLPFITPPAEHHSPTSLTFPTPPRPLPQVTVRQFSFHMKKKINDKDDTLELISENMKKENCWKDLDNIHKSRNTNLK